MKKACIWIFLPHLLSRNTCLNIFACVVCILHVSYPLIVKIQIVNMHLCMGYHSIWNAFRLLVHLIFLCSVLKVVLSTQWLVFKIIPNRQKHEPQSLDVQRDSHYILSVRKFRWATYSEKERGCLACKNCRTCSKSIGMVFMYSR